MDNCRLYVFRSKNMTIKLMILSQLKLLMILFRVNGHVSCHCGARNVFIYLQDHHLDHRIFKIMIGVVICFMLSFFLYTANPLLIMAGIRYHYDYRCHQLNHSDPLFFSINSILFRSQSSKKVDKHFHPSKISSRDFFSNEN